MSNQYGPSYTFEDASEWYPVYQKTGSSVITAKQFGVHSSTVIRVLNRFGFQTNNTQQASELRRLKVKHPERFRGNLTEESLYWLGFILADGCINDYQKHAALTFRLQERDGQHLWKLKEFLGSESKPKKVEAPSVIHPAVDYRVAHEIIIKDLADYGITPRKSAVIDVDNRLSDSHHFWRGVIDGNGSLSLRPPRLRLVGTKGVCDKFLRFAQTIIPDTSATVRPKEGFLHSVELGHRKAFQLMSHLYEGSSIYLERKNNIYLQVKGKYENEY